MLKRKNILSLSLLLILSFLLIGCSKNESIESTIGAKENISINIVINENGKEIHNKNLEIPEDNRVLLDILKDNFDIEEDNGFITAIDGMEQDPDSNIYWLYLINGEFAEVGTKEYKVENNDKIEFNLENIDNE